MGLTPIRSIARGVQSLLHHSAAVNMQQDTSTVPGSQFSRQVSDKQQSYQGPCQFTINHGVFFLSTCRQQQGTKRLVASSSIW
jgi:hypothetical protein